MEMGQLILEWNTVDKLGKHPNVVSMICAITKNIKKGKQDSDYRKNEENWVKPRVVDNTLFSCPCTASPAR